MEEASRYLFLVAGCGGKQVDVNVREQTRCKHKAKGRPTGSKSNPKNGRWEEEEVYGRTVPVKRKNEVKK